MVALICGVVIITGLGWYNTLGRIGGAGAAVPITGFANSIVAPAMEYKKEGVVMGVGAKIFSLAGPVLAVGFSFRRHRRSLHAHRQNSLGGGYYGRDKGKWRKKIRQAERGETPDDAAGRAKAAKEKQERRGIADEICKKNRE